MAPVDEVAQEIIAALFAVQKKVGRKPSMSHLASFSGPTTRP
jgi:hypothetical protein